VDEGEPEDADPGFIQLPYQLIHQFLLQSKLLLSFNRFLETTWQPIQVILNQCHYVTELQPDKHRSHYNYCSCYSRYPLDVKIE
jgi:hypothetical protein